MLSYPDFQPALRYDYDRSRIDGADSTSEYMMKGHTSSCLSVELSPNARYLASGGTDSVICLWDTQDWICQRTFTDMVGPVKSLSESFPLSAAVPLSHALASLAMQIIYQILTLVTCAGFTFDGFYVCGGSDEGTGIEVYHCDSGERVHTFKTATPSPVVAWAPTRYMLAYSDLGQLRIIEAQQVDRK